MSRKIRCAFSISPFVILALLGNLACGQQGSSEGNLAAGDPNLSNNPVLLIPGIAGSVLESSSTNNRVITWVAGFSLFAARSSYTPLPGETCTASKDISAFGVSLGSFKICYSLSGGDANFRTYLLGLFDPSTSTIVPAFGSAMAPITPLKDDLCSFSEPGELVQDQLCGVAYLAAPTGSGISQFIEELLFTYLDGRLGTGIDYYGPMIDSLRDNYGLKPGVTLFGFPYDWRLSNVTNADNLAARVTDICDKTGKKINIVAHSMGNMVTMAFLAKYGELANRCVQNWVAIAAPFQGAGANIYQAAIEGYNFGDVFVCKCSARPFSIQAPSVFELMPSPTYPNDGSSPTQPFLKYTGPSGPVTLQSRDAISNFLKEAYRNFSFCNDDKTQKFAFNDDAFASGVNLRDNVLPMLSNANLPNVYIVYGTNTNTTFGVEYTTPVSGPAELIANCGPDNCNGNLCQWPSCNSIDNTSPTAKCHFVAQMVDGDGTVPALSASTPPFAKPSSDRVLSVPGVDHVGLVRNLSVVDQVFQGWLKYPKKKT